MQSQAVCGRVFPPPSIDFGVAVLGITDARVMQVANVAPHLVKPPSLRFDAQQRAAWVMGTAQPLNATFGVFEDSFVIFHGRGHRDRSIVRVVPANQCNVGLLPGAERLLQRSRPGACLGKQQAPRCLEIEPVNGVHATADLVSDALQTRVRPGVVGVSMHQQSGRFGDNNPMLGFIEDVQGGAGKHLRGVTRE